MLQSGKAWSVAIPHDATERDPVDEFAITGVSCPELCASYGVDVREFVLLACLKELGAATTNALRDFIGLTLLRKADL